MCLLAVEALALFSVTPVSLLWMAVEALAHVLRALTVGLSPLGGAAVVALVLRALTPPPLPAGCRWL